MKQFCWSLPMHLILTKSEFNLFFKNFIVMFVYEFLSEAIARWLIRLFVGLQFSIEFMPLSIHSMHEVFATKCTNAIKILNASIIRWWRLSQRAQPLIYFFLQYQSFIAFMPALSHALLLREKKHYKYNKTLYLNSTI